MSLSIILVYLCAGAERRYADAGAVTEDIDSRRHASGRDPVTAVMGRSFAALLRKNPSRDYIRGMDAGLWTLECPNCGEHFDLELGHGEELIRLLKTKVCPNCDSKPTASTTTWHRIVDFHLPKHLA